MASVTIASNPPGTQFASVQAFNGQSVPISMSVPLPAGCFDFHVKVYATTNGLVAATGSSSALLNVQFSPQ